MWLSWWSANTGAPSPWYRRRRRVLAGPLLLAPLLLAVARRGVFASVGSAAGPAAGAAGPAAGAAVLPVNSLESVDNRLGRPLLVLALSGVTEQHVLRHVQRLVGALVYDVSSGAVYRAARYADVGPLVLRVGTCRQQVTELDDVVSEPSPMGWQDLRLVNRTFKFVGRQSMSDIKGIYPEFSQHYAMEDMLQILEQGMRFRLQNMSWDPVPFSELLYGIKNRSLDMVVDYFHDTPERRRYLSFPLNMGTSGSFLFFGRPAAVSHSSFLGGPFANGVGRALLAGLLLLLVLASYLALVRDASSSGPAASWLQAVALLSSQGLLSQLPGRPWQHVAAAVGCLAALLTAQLYTAGLLSRLTMEVTEIPFQELDDVLEAPDWQWAFSRGTSTEEALLTSDRPGANFARCPTAVKKNAQVGDHFDYNGAEAGKFAFFTSIKIVQSECTWNACPNLCRHTTELFHKQYSVPFHRDEPTIIAWYLAFLRMRETGIWSHLQRRHEPRLEGASFECDFKPRPRQQYSALELDECAVPFAILLYGALLSCGILSCELLAAKLKLYLHK